MMDVYLVTRPIQYINVLNLPFDISGSTLIIQNSFTLVDKINKLALRDTKRWSTVIRLNTNNEIFKWLFHNRKRITRLTSYTDIGIRWYLLFEILRKDVEINIYEEGLATYNKSELKGIKWVLYSLLNKRMTKSLYIGANHKIKNLFVYDVQLHNKLIPECAKKMKNLSFPLIELMKREKLTDLQYSENGRFRDKKILLFVTNWEYNKAVESYLNEYEDYIKIIKPHPKLKLNQKQTNLFDFCIKAEFVSEIVIAELLNEAYSLIVIHEGTTSMLHFKCNEKFKEICLSSETCEAYWRVKAALSDF